MPLYLAEEDEEEEEGKILFVFTIGKIKQIMDKKN